MNKESVLITGCTSGIGLSLCYFFLKQNFKVIGISRQPEHKIKNQIKNKNFKYICADLSIPNEYNLLIKKINKISNINYLINNAGRIKLKENKKNNSFNSLFYLNSITPINLSLFFIKKYKFKSIKKIINIGSNAFSNFKLNELDLKFVNNDNNYSTYSKSKLILMLLTKKISIDYSKKISVFYLHPGFVKTNIFKNLSYFQKLFYRIALFFFGNEIDKSTIYVGNFIIKNNFVKNGFYQFGNNKINKVWSKLSKNQISILWKNLNILNKKLKLNHVQ